MSVCLSICRWLQLETAIFNCIDKNNFGQIIEVPFQYQADLARRWETQASILKQLKELQVIRSKAVYHVFN